jgi:hypothetical protein
VILRRPSVCNWGLWMAINQLAWILEIFKTHKELAHFIKILSLGPISKSLFIKIHRNSFLQASIKDCVLLTNSFTQSRSQRADSSEQHTMRTTPSTKTPSTSITLTGRIVSRSFWDILILLSMIRPFWSRRSNGNSALRDSGSRGFVGRSYTAPLTIWSKP